MNTNKNELFRTKLADVYEALVSVSGMEITYLPEDMKFSLLSNICEAKVLLAEEVFAHHSEIEFEVTEDSIRVMREVVRDTLNNDNQ
jgi:hypothetical protein